jgi:hypothetical protein
MKWLKENFIRIIILLILIASVVTTFNFCNFHYKETSSLFYSFSTIAQTIGAILGIISAVLVFTVASLDSKRDSLKPIIIETLKKAKPNKLINHLKLEEFVKTEKILKQLKDDPTYMDFVVVISTYKGLRLYKDYILTSIKFPIIISAVTIVYCIFGIVVTELILVCNIGLTMAVLAILLCSWTILEITYYIIRLPDIATSLELELDNILDED